MIVYGADIGFRRISLCALDGDRSEFEVLSASLPTKAEVGHAETFVLLQAAAHRLANELTKRLGAPNFCAVEKPAAHPERGVSQEMCWSYALVMAVLQQHAPTAGLMPQSWKSAALGKGFGRADKDTILAWARRFGYSGSSKDEADAIGIAVAALRQRQLEAEPQTEQLQLGG